MGVLRLKKRNLYVLVDIYLYIAVIKYIFSLLFLLLVQVPLHAPEVHGHLLLDLIHPLVDGPGVKIDSIITRFSFGNGTLESNLYWCSLQ